MFLSLLGCAVLTLLAALAPSPRPDTWPDFWPVVVSAYSSVHFVAFAVYLNYVQLFCDSDPYWQPLSNWKTKRD